MIDATNIRLTDKIDLTSSKYRYSGDFCRRERKKIDRFENCFVFQDYLLCHDDDIHGTVEGRRIAYIYYLVPHDWEEKDGGALDLFETDGKIQ